MKLDLNLVRSLLAHVSGQTPTDNLIDLSIDGYDEGTVSDHVRLLDSLGYVAAVSVWTFQGDVWKSVQITWKGADLLTAAGDDVVWNRAKQMVDAQVMGSPEFKLGAVKGLLDSATNDESHPSR